MPLVRRPVRARRARVRGFRQLAGRPGPRDGARVHTTLPDAPLTISGPGEESGTYDYFVEQVVTAVATERGKDNATRKDYQSSPNDNVIIEGIAGPDTSLGWVGFAYAEENLDKVKFLEVVEGARRVCRADHRDDRRRYYPLCRNLYIYVNKAKAADNAALAAFVDFYLAEGTVSTVNRDGPLHRPRCRRAGRKPRRLGRSLTAAPPAIGRPGACPARPADARHGSLTRRRHDRRRPNPTSCLTSRQRARAPA